MGKSFVYNDGISNDDIKTDELRLEFGVFIDGTLNNKENTKIRKIVRGETDEHVIIDGDSKHYKDNLKQEALQHKAVLDGAILEDKRLENPKDYTKYLKGVHRTFTEQLGTDNSYSNDYTNVARMWMCCKEEYKIYVEGMGSIDLMHDDDDGFMFGKGPTGIRGRVREACKRVAEKIKIEKDKKENKKKIISQITVDVFGFSRGAASARNFIYEVTKWAYDPKEKKVEDGYYPINPYRESLPRKKYKKVAADDDLIEISPDLLIEGQLPKYGYLGYYLLEQKIITPKELKDIEVIIRFVGVYDTVSSYDEEGWILSYDFDNDVSELHLNSGSFQKMVHFTAKDEHRTNFALTRIHKSQKAIEKNFPGVHCDIGGAYEHGPEVIDEIGTSLKDTNFKKDLKWGPIAPIVMLFTKTGLEELKESLVEQYWYRPEELAITKQYIPHLYNPITRIVAEALSYKKLTGTKKMVRKDYSWIFVHFMEEFCRTTTMEQYFNLKTEDKYPIAKDSFLGNVEEQLHRYVFEDGKEWEFKSDAQLAREREEREKLDVKLKEFERNEEIESYNKPSYDNLNPMDYRPTIDKIIPKIKIEPTEPEPTLLEEVIVYGYDVQKALRTLRHDYCHWSSTRDWFGMDPNGGFFSSPTENRKREFH
ncbi:DUF2235 domain-containing protein [[Flexibacter] sp. ATCC 35103]|uniref:phospholipase effector Tle1 domain-containing protein n=1 Tax=[Flexibacter] sp. ATCC 35103 TaxID=1937528 RepID=UPI0009C9B1DA|nr:DUF2235 domain-containing protein [[Flexibacter] sp. ATCC 35103]OMQ13504.1 hypothetical protein BXU01_03230 [[Flexibacter] sp. ATCC 35103]